MKYLISNQKNLFETDLYKEITFKEAKEYLWELDKIQFDTETAGLDVFTKPLLCYQLGHKDNQFVFDQSSYSITFLKDLFESDRKFIGHNLLFDLKYLYYYDIWPQHIIDTMLREQLIWLGWGTPTFYAGISKYEYEKNNYKWPYLDSINRNGENIRKFSTSLKAVAHNRLGIELDKTVRGMITKVGLIPEVVQYAATDVEWLEDIEESQQIDIDREELQSAADLENEFVKTLAYIEFCGVKLDKDKWKAKMAIDQSNLNNSVSKLNRFVLDYFNSHGGNIRNKTVITENIVDTQWIHNEEELKKYGINLKAPSKKPKKYYTKNSGNDDLGILYCEEIETPYPWVEQNLQGDLFTGFDTKPYCTLNWSSTKQLIPFFELMGYNLEIFDKKEKRKKKSVAAEVIKSQEKINPELSKAYTNFKKFEKICDSFGEKWLKAINPVTGRIHADFHQLGTDTARLSSGGGESGVNVQQIPKNPETRACFVSEKDNVWLSLDYESQESQILASVTNDPALLELYTTGCKDLHSLTAYMSYPNIIPRDTPISDIGKLYPEWRQAAKGIEFAIGYAGDANTIASNSGIPLEEAEKIYNSYMEGFPGVKKYQDYCKKNVLEKGYILMNPITEHRAHIADWENKWKPIRDKMKSPDFWQYYRELKSYDPYCETIQEIRKFFKVKSDMEKQSVNYRIQNRGAMCTKLAGILLFNWIVKNRYQGIVKICLQVHDEYNCECPAEMGEEVAKIIKKCMEKGARPFCRRLPLSSSVSRKKDGNLPNYWIH